MRKIFLILTCFLFFILISCSGGRKEQRKESSLQGDPVLIVVEESADDIEGRSISKDALDSLRVANIGGVDDRSFLGMTLGITQSDYESERERLISSNALFQYSASGLYAYSWGIEGRTIWAIPYPSYKNNLLKEIKFVCWDSDGGNSVYFIYDHFNKEIHPSYIHDDKNYWFRKGAEICLSKELVDNDPYPKEETGVLYLRSLN